MIKNKIEGKKLIVIVVGVVLLVGLLVSIGFNIYQTLTRFESYLQDPEEIYIMEAGMLRDRLKFKEGEKLALQYDFTHPDYAILKQTYDIEKIAKSGTELERALRLMNEFAPRLHHKSNYDNHIPINALALLEYSLDNKKQGINCRNKAQILNEMCLALGIYARKVWIMPNSRYDGDCHVVNEVWDTTLNKWVMLDITNNEYWLDENQTPLSVLEIRTKLAMREFCTPVMVGDSFGNLQKLKEKRMGDFLYIAKNMMYMEYCAKYGVGEGETIYLLMPEYPEPTYEYIIDLSMIEKSPIK